MPATVTDGKIYFEHINCDSPPANDDFANALVLAGASGSTAAIPLTCATVEASEPIGSCATTIAWQTLWYSWTAAANGTLTVDTVTIDYNPQFFCDFVSEAMYNILTVYTGATLGTLAEVACNDGTVTPPFCYATVSFAVTNGTTYMVQVSSGGDGTVDDIGDVTVNWSFV